VKVETYRGEGFLVFSDQWLSQLISTLTYPIGHPVPSPIHRVHLHDRYHERLRELSGIRTYLHEDDQQASMRGLGGIVDELTAGSGVMVAVSVTMVKCVEP